ncbi:MAG: nitroreductase family protein [Clostridia bacterium]|nr:nitroreductase family protein [Clostridia bacterium]
MDFFEFIKSRRTIRKFKSTPLTAEQLKRYIDAARVAPSAANMQPLKYIAVSNPDMSEKIFPFVKWAGYLAGEYNPKDGEHPTAYVAVCADTDIRQSGYDVDMGAAVENMILAALADGVGSCWIGSIDHEKISELLEIPDNLKLLCVLALGYPAETPEETVICDESVKYFIGENGNLHVPKRSIDDVLIKTF